MENTAIERTCLICKWMDEPQEPHLYHGCTYPADRFPACLIDWDRAVIDITMPFHHCGTYEPR